MDTSETYIKMCEKAEEIQVEKKCVERGDNWCWKSYPDKVYFRSENSPLEMYDSRNKRESNNKIWLPRQDQLQDMMFPNPQDSINIQANRITNLFALEDYNNSGCTGTYYFTTWEQLWLAFAMKEKFGKVWNGEEWIKA